MTIRFPRLAYPCVFALLCGLAAAQNNAGTINVGQSSTVLTANVSITAAGAPSSVGVVTKGAEGLDFTAAGANTCVGEGSFAVGQSCTVTYTFSPKSAGERLGAAVVKDSSGNVLGTGYLTGIGSAPLGLFTAPTAAWTVSETTDGTAFSGPRGVSVDGNGNLYFLDTGNGRLIQVPAGGGAPVVLASGINSHDGGATAVDGAGNVYVSSNASGAVSDGIYELVNGALKNIASIATPDDNLTADGAGNLYLTGGSTGGIYRMDAITPHTLVRLYTYASGQRFIGMAVDPNGNIFAVNYGGNQLYELPVANQLPGGNGALVTLVNNVYANASGPHSVALDPAGNIYVGGLNSATSAIYRYTCTGLPGAPACSQTILPATGTASLAIDGDGNMYAVEGNSVVEYTRTTAPTATFGATVYGATTAVGAGEPIEFENDGNAGLNITAYAATANFGANGTGNTCGVETLNPGATCQIVASFTPAAVGGLSGTLTATDNTLNRAGTPQSVNLTGTATAATLTVTASAPAATYGTVPTIMPIYSGFLFSDSPGSLTTPPTCFTTQIATTQAYTPYNSTCTGGTAANYTFQYVHGSGMVGQATLTVTASSGAFVYGGTPPTITPIISGLLNGDRATVVNGLSCGTQASSSSPVGSYASYCSGGIAINYGFAYDGGTVTVTLVPQNISFPALASPVTVNANATLAATATSGEAVGYTVTAGTALIAGGGISYTNAGTVTITATAPATGKFAAAGPVFQTVTVNPEPVSYAAPETTVGQSTAVQVAYVNFTAGGTLGSVAVVTQGAAGLDFNPGGNDTCVVGAAYSAGQACEVDYVFRPQSPGQRQGGIVLKDGNGNLLGVSYLGGVGDGPLGLFSSPTASGTVTATAAPNFSAARGISVDGAGNLYFASTGSPEGLDEIPAGTTNVIQIAAASVGTGATAVDGAGNVYLASANQREIFELVNGNLVPLALNLVFAPDDNLEVDGAGNLYTSDYATGAIYEIPAGGTSVTTLIPGNQGRRFIGLAVDPAGDIFAPDFNHNILYEVTAGSATLTQLASGAPLSNPHAVAIDPAGNVYVANYSGASNILRYAANTWQVTALPATGSRSLVLDGQGNLYAGTDSTIAEYSRLAPPTVNFPSTVYGQTSTAAAVEFENDGNAPLVVSSYGASANFGAAGAGNNCGAGSMLVGATCAIVATFTPTSVSASFAGALTIADNSAAGGTQALNLQGASTHATATIQVTGYNVTYDAAAHTAAATATGAASANLASDLNLAGTTHTNAGTYNGDTWSFHDPNGDYADASGTVNDVITSATAAITVTPYGVTYDGNAHTAAAAATGVGGAILPATDFSLAGTTHTSAGTYASDPWSFSDPNYASANGTVADGIAPATLTISGLTANNKQYDATTAATLSGAPTLAGAIHAGDSPALAGAPVGSFASASVANGIAVTASGTLTGPGASNYVVTGLTTPLAANITPAPLTVSGLSAESKVYDTTAAATLMGSPVLVGTIYGSDTVAINAAVGNQCTKLHLCTPLAAFTGTFASPGVGTPVAVTLAFTAALSNGNYYLAGPTSPLSANITPAPLTIGGVAANNKTYDGTTAATLGGAAALNGVLGTDNVGLAGSPSAVFSQANVGTGLAVTVSGYTLTGAAASNYSLTQPSGLAANITPAAATVTVTPYSVTYDGNAHTATGIVTGVGGVSLSGLNLAGTTHTSAGTYAADAWSFTDSTGNYSNASGTVSDVITKANITLAWNPPAAVPYGTALGSAQLDATSGGFGGGFSYAPGAGAVLAAGNQTLTVTFTPTDATDYNPASASVRLVVTPVALVITAGSQTQAYGATPAPVTAAYAGFVNGDGVNRLTTPPACSTTAANTSVPGSYPTSCAGAVDPNYAISYVNGTDTVIPATLLVSADPVSCVYGTCDGDSGRDDAVKLAYTVSGLANGQTAAQVLYGQPQETANVPENQAAAVGTYTIALAQGQLRLSPAYASLYSLTIAGATYTITPATLTVAATSQSDVYGQTDHDDGGHLEGHRGYTITGFAWGERAGQVLRGRPDLTTTETPTSGVGSYPITISAGSLQLEGPYAGDYTIVYTNGTRTVTPAQLTVVANSYSRAMYTPNPAFGYTVTGFVNGDTPATALTGAPIIATAASSSSPAGNYVIVVSPGSLAAQNGNYTLRFVNGELIVYNRNDRDDPHCDGRGNYSPNPVYDCAHWQDGSSYALYWANGRQGPNVIVCNQGNNGQNDGGGH